MRKCRITYIQSDTMALRTGEVEVEQINIYNDKVIFNSGDNRIHLHNVISVEFLNPESENDRPATETEILEKLVKSAIGFCAYRQFLDPEAAKADYELFKGYYKTKTGKNITI